MELRHKLNFTWCSSAPKKKPLIIFNLSLQHTYMLNFTLYVGSDVTLKGSLHYTSRPVELIFKFDQWSLAFTQMSLCQSLRSKVCVGGVGFRESSMIVNGILMLVLIVLSYEVIDIGYIYWWVSPQLLYRESSQRIMSSWPAMGLLSQPCEPFLRGVERANRFIIDSLGSPNSYILNQL